MNAFEFHEVFGRRANYWADHQDYPVSDWQYEVANGDTRLGYWDWVISHVEQAAQDGQGG